MYSILRRLWVSLLVNKKHDHKHLHSMQHDKQTAITTRGGSTSAVMSVVVYCIYIYYAYKVGQYER